MLSQNILKSLLHYNELTGLFTWIVKPSANVKAGQVAGSKDVNGYVRIRINGKNYPAHRLAFLYMLGFVPEFIDHINQIKNDNRWVNIRECSNRENHFNIGLQKNNKTGYKGVSFCNKNKKFRAQTRLNGVNKTIGYFDNAKDAGLAYAEHNKNVHKEFGFFPNVILAR